MTTKGFAARRRIAQSELIDGAPVKPSILKVCSRYFSFSCFIQLSAEEICSIFVHLDQVWPVMLCSSFFSRPRPRLRDWNAALFRDQLHSFGKFALLHSHDEVVDVAALAAPEAIENLFDRRNCEGRRLFLVKRTEPAEVLAGFFQPDVFPHHADDVRLLLHLLRK